MKLTNKILEAINRGIKFALDDFDNEELQGQINSKVRYQGGMNEYIDLMNEVVDLGLPSGTLWCKYNLGVNPNLLSKAEDWYGDYYAWGELEPNKNWWNSASYKFTGKMKKYNNYDKLINLLPEDDAAYQNKKLYNFKFHIPTKELCEELIWYTTISEYQENYNNVDGLNGYILTSNINNNKIFIPKAGYWYWKGFNKDSVIVSCANRYEADPDRCYFLQHYSSNMNLILNNVLSRICGLPIRPVINL